LLSTATSEKTKHDNLVINIYRGRTFRFSFTNHKMVDALFGFVEKRHFPAEHREWAQNLWVSKAPEPTTLAQSIAGMACRGDPWCAWSMLAGYPYLQPYMMYAVPWQDERYSQDMAELFEAEFKQRFPVGEFSLESPILYSLGGFFHAAPQEQAVVGAFLARTTPIKPHSLLVLPTGTVRMRRFLLNLRQRSPADARNLVVLNGDAISFTSVYRDREVVWNVLDLPYSLVFFSHRNPIDHTAGFTWTKDDRAAQSIPPQTTTGTQDVLLYRDVFEAFLYAASNEGRVLDNPLEVRARLKETRWHQSDREPSRARVSNKLVHSLEALPFFDADGNRAINTGEHVVWLKPNFTDDRVDLESKISVWARRPDGNGGAWHLSEARNATYNQSRLEEEQ
jgi:hypothetical protein